MQIEGERRLEERPAIGNFQPWRALWGDKQREKNSEAQHRTRVGERFNDKKRGGKTNRRRRAGLRQYESRKNKADK